MSIVFPSPPKSPIAAYYFFWILIQNLCQQKAAKTKKNESKIFLEFKTIVLNFKSLFHSGPAIVKVLDYSVVPVQCDEYRSISRIPFEIIENISSFSCRYYWFVSSIHRVLYYLIDES